MAGWNQSAPLNTPAPTPKYRAKSRPSPLQGGQGQGKGSTRGVLQWTQDSTIWHRVEAASVVSEPDPEAAPADGGKGNPGGAPVVAASAGQELPPAITYADGAALAADGAEDATADGSRVGFGKGWKGDLPENRTGPKGGKGRRRPNPTQARVCVVCGYSEHWRHMEGKQYWSAPAMTREQAQRADTIWEVPDLRENARVQKPGQWWEHTCVACVAARDGIPQAEAATRIGMRKAARNIERARPRATSRPSPTRRHLGWWKRGPRALP